MNIKKFVAATSREALRQVRAALGGDAVIVANRPHAAGVEILAAAANEVSTPAVSPPAQENLIQVGRGYGNADVITTAQVARAKKGPAITTKTESVPKAAPQMAL